MREFFLRIWNCCFHPSTYYKDVRKKTFWQGSGHLYWLLVCTTFISALVFAVQAFLWLPHVRSWVEDARKDIPTLFPSELVLTLSGGQLSTNVTEPYVFPVPDRLSKAILSSDANDGERVPSRFLVIDTQASIEDYPAYDSLVLLTKTAAVGRDRNGIRVALFSEIQKPGTAPMVFDRTVYQEVTSKILPFLMFLPGLLILCVILGLIFLPWAGAAFGVLSYWVNLLLMTLFAWIAAALMGRTTGYRELYRVGLYAVTPTVLLAFLLGKLHAWPMFASTAVYLLIMVLALRSFPKAKKK